MSSHSTNIIAVTSVLGCLAILAVVLRFWSRRKLRGPKYGPDDWVIVPALLFTISLCVNNIVGATVGRIGQHEIYNTSSGLASGYPLASELKPFGKVCYSFQKGCRCFSQYISMLPYLMDKVLNGKLTANLSRSSSPYRFCTRARCLSSRLLSFCTIADSSLRLRVGFTLLSGSLLAIYCSGGPPSYSRLSSNAIQSGRTGALKLVYMASSSRRFVC